MGRLVFSRYMIIYFVIVDVVTISNEIVVLLFLVLIRYILLARM